MGRKSNFTEEQIIRALREVDAGATAAEVCRRVGVSEQTFYRWKAKYGGMDVSDAKRLKQLEDENDRLKKLLADQMLDNQALKLVLSKNGEAGGLPPRCRLRAGGDEAVHAPQLQGVGFRALEHDVRVAPRAAVRPGRAHEGAGDAASEVRLPKAAHAVGARGLQGESQARVPPVQARGSLGAEEGAAEARRTHRAHHAFSADSPQRAMVHGLRVRRDGDRTAVPHLQHRRRLHARVPGHLRGQFNQRAQGRAREAPVHRQRQRPGVHQQGARSLGLRDRGEAALHSPGQAGRERLHRKLQRSLPRRVPRSALVRRLGRRPLDHRCLAR